MIDFDALQRLRKPFPHWVADAFIDDDQLRAINAAWPTDAHPGWMVETSVGTAAKGQVLFPCRLPAPAQDLAEALCSPAALERLSALVGYELLADPWLHEGPPTPRLGGGLHEIYPGGLLNVHVDFERHPSGLKRVANLLLYLNEEWRVEWGGALELHGKSVRSIVPAGGRAVFFETTPDSWHGHPHPLQCPPGRTRRSLALYYYAQVDGGEQRPKTVYRSKRCA